MARRIPPIVLMTDFGTADWYVACMKGVIVGLCPQTNVIDLTHDIPPQDVVAGAFTLAAAAGWFPDNTIFACVVDPGVGAARPLIAASADRRMFIGPDNGLFALVFHRARRLSIVQLTNPRYWLPEISRTFHGRDILAPVAAHVARGCALRHLGVPRKRYASLPLPSVTQTARTLRGRVMHIDTFGNLITNLPAELLHTASWEARYRRQRAPVVSTYAQGRRGELIALVGSAGYLELALPNGSAARRYQAKRGDAVELCRS